MNPLLANNFEATPSTLSRMREAVLTPEGKAWLERNACLSGGCSEAGAEEWVIAINEACMNIIEHAYHYADNRQYRIELRVHADCLSALICDNGDPVQLDKLQPRELDDLRPGGLGVRFMRELTDTMEYLPPDSDWHNRLQLSKRIR